MARPLTLAAYLALRGGDGAAPADRPWPPRPPGRLVWLHVPSAADLPRYAAVTEQAEVEGLPLRVLMTSSDIPADASVPPGIILQEVPPDQRGPAGAFLRHWRPDLLLWAEGRLRPALLAQSDELGVPRSLIGGRAELLRSEGGAWLPGLVSALLRGFERALVADQAAQARLAKAGLAAGRIEVTGPLLPIVRPLTCNDRERRDLAQTLGTRPVWLAAGVPMAELDEMIAAHRFASRSSHRLLLILVPQDPGDAPAMAGRLRADGLQTALRGDGAEPEEQTEVYVCDTPSEIGLWYRLAPVTYLGGTLSGLAVRHPFEAAALGSAIVHGPATAAHAEAFARLCRAGAARAIRSGAALGPAVEALLAPDRAAVLAHAAWDVSSAGAEVASRIVALIRDRLGRSAA